MKPVLQSEEAPRTQWGWVQGRTDKTKYAEMAESREVGRKVKIIPGA